jgi:amino acid adenylation domain-containing protein
VPVQYGEYAVWERAWLTAAKRAQLEGYWRARLRGAPPVVGLPTDRPRPAVQTFRGAVHWEALAAEVEAGVRALSREAGVTLYMTLLAAFQAMLSRYTGQADVVVGTPVAQRPRAELEGVVGLFVNTVVLRTEVGGELTLAELVQRVRGVVVEALAHQALPFEQVVAAVQPVRDLSHNPVVQVLFALQQVPPVGAGFAGLEGEVVEVGSEATRMDVELHVWESAAGVRMSWVYNTDLFDAATIVRMAGHYQAVLAALVATPTERVGAVRLVRPGERRQVVEQWNATAVAYPGPATLGALFGAQVARTPEAVALEEGERRVTYAQLDARANRVAHWLRAAGVESGVPVGVYGERSIEQVVGLLASLKAGGAYLPLDPVYPPARVAFMVRDAGAPVVLTVAEHVVAAAALPAEVVALDDPTPFVDQPTTPPPIPTDPAAPAYIIYTSGSTGKPKGVIGIHEGAVNRFKWMWKAYPFASGERCCQKTSPSFGDAVWEVFGPLLQGVPSVILNDLDVRDPRRLVRLLADRAVTRIVLVPSLLRALLDTHPTLGEQVPTLQHWVTSGEALSAELAMRFHRQVPGRVLLNLYGTSEVSADATFFEVPATQRQDPVPIGRPIANTQAYVLDEQGQSVPVGVVGELYIGGIGVARGYVNCPDLTAQRFVTVDVDGTSRRLFRTGDRVRFRSDGTLEYLGRRDGMVNVRGFRVELREIELVLNGHPSVRQSVVGTYEAIEGDLRLIAYVVPDAATPCDVRELRSHLAATLPGYMIPGRFHLLDDLPLTAGGKVDRKRLPPPDELSETLPGQRARPTDAIEEELTRIWADVLGMKRVGVHDDFFELGGHSLLAVALMERVSHAFARDLPLSTLFVAPTVSGLAAVLREGGGNLPWAPAVPIQPAGGGPPFFCVAPILGIVFPYYDLARRVGDAQPFFGMQPRGLDGKTPPHDDLVAMAAYYVDAVRKIQPEGPYRLGGWSFGGVVALEMAQQLRGGGADVSLLAMLDTPAPVPSMRPSIFQMARFGMDLLVRYSWRYMSDYLYLRHAVGPYGDGLGNDSTEDGPRHRHFSLQNVLMHSAMARVMSPDSRKVLLRQAAALPLFRIFRASSRAIQRYRAAPYQGCVSLFRTAASLRKHGDSDPLMGWGAIAQQGVDVVDVPGTHMDCVRAPNVAVLAEGLRRALNGGPSTMVEMSARHGD